MTSKINKDTNDSIQNKFTAYLLRAINRRRIDYLENESRKAHIDRMLYQKLSSKFELDLDRMISVPVHMQLKNDLLIDTLLQLSDREKYIFLQHTLCEVTFDKLAQELGLSYKGVAAIYYRTMKKVQKCMRRENNEF